MSSLEWSGSSILTWMNHLWWPHNYWHSCQQWLEHVWVFVGASDGRAERCCPPEAHPRLPGPIVVSWLLPVCFSGSLISQEETWTSTSERSSAGSQDRIKRSPLLYRELLLHLRKAAPLNRDYYFWQCLSQEGTFADLMGPGLLYAAFCMAPCHHFHRERKKQPRMLSKVNFKQERCV